MYAPDINKLKEKIGEFYNPLQDIIIPINPQEKIIIMRDLCAGTGNNVLNGITDRFNEKDTNDNSDHLKYYCA